MTNPRNITFHKSSFSDQQGNCVEVGRDTDGSRLVRDSKDRTIAPQHYTSSTWTSFLRDIKSDRFS